MSSTEARTFARALYETLLGNTLTQLRAASTKLNGAAEAGTVADRIATALPAESLPEVRNFLAVLASENALDQLPAIISAFEQYTHDSLQEVLTGDVTSAQALSAVQQGRIGGELRERYGKQLELEFKVDPSLIGGLIIRVGDQVLDNSLRSRLSVVQRSMLGN